MKSNIKVLMLAFGLSTFVNAEVLVFSKAYQLALENANSIKSAVFMAESSQERLAQEESRLYPQVNASGYYKKSEYNYNPTLGRANTKIDQGLISYGVSIKQSLYNAEVYSKIDLETSRSELSKLSVELEKEALAQTVFKVYLELLKMHNKIDLYKRYLEYSKTKLDELEKKYIMRMVNKMDLLEMRVEYKSVQIDLEKEKKLLKVYQLKLDQLIGNTSEYQLGSIKLNDEVFNSIEFMTNSVKVASNFSSNLQLLQAKLAVKVSKQEIENAFDAHYPKLDLDASYNKYQTDDPTEDSLYSDVENVMLRLNIPIYSGGYISSRVKESRLKSFATAEDLINTQQEIQVQYDEYLAIFDASVSSVSMYKDAYESSVLAVEAVEKGYSHGLKSITDLNDARNKQYEVKYKYIENIYEMVDSYIGLLIVTNNFENIELLDSLVN